MSLQLVPYAPAASTAEEAITAAKGVCTGTRDLLERQLKDAGADLDTVRAIFSDWDERLVPRWTKEYLDLRIAASKPPTAG
ncbi:hypothetical protein V3391_00920 [Luteimonas sp. SMYT11W]|uniref:Transaldolase n=1 Tax=Luteimonas flava TaxID=3115822 RepID=A0ABU7W9Y5_9GAMM